ncbi:MAG TPA: hypothetical protein VK181_09775 [Rhizobium sp.]|nr:hypothetical protein [Rhizobium sp.]
MSFDNVDRPQHYNSHPSGIQPVEIAEHMVLTLGTAFIYGWRYNMKGTPLEDLRKMRWWLLRQQEHNAQLPWPSASQAGYFRGEVMPSRKHAFNRPSPWCEPVRHALAALCDWHSTESITERGRLLSKAIQCIDTAIADECCFDGRSMQP